MTNPRTGRIPSELGWLIDELDDVQSRLSTLEAPSGEALGSTVAKLQSLVEGIQEQLDAWAANRWTNDEILTKIDERIAAALAGNVTIGGTLDVAGAVTMPGVRATDVSLEYDRIVVWVAGNGKVGHT